MFPQELTRSQKAGLTVAVIAIATILGVLLWFLLTHPVATAAIRDISIILLAIAVIVLDIILVFLMLQLIQLLTYLIQELRPIVESLQETTGTVRGTTTFMSDSVVNPAIEVASKAAGVRKSFSVLLGTASDLRPGSQPKSGGESDG
ncbi:MAG: hypothetical protein U9R25_16820 [Chloroflexota bacterium]|nr:hypothetical protein [Chloroflexota bacterium]